MIKHMAPTETRQPYSELDKIIHANMVAAITGSDHGSNFDIREFSEDPYGINPLRVDTIMYESWSSEFYQDEAAKWVMANPDNTPDNVASFTATFFGAMIATNFDEIVDAMVEVYDSNKVRDHREGGGSIIFESGHVTYADIVVEMMASYLARKRLKEQNIAQTQIATVSLIIPEFVMPVLVDDLATGEKRRGFVLEDGLMHLGRVRKTIPDSKTGHNTGMSDDERTRITSMVIRSFIESLAGPNIELLAGSGTFDIEGLMHRLNEPTAKLLAHRNTLVIPTYMNVAPFNDGKLKPHYVRFAFLDPVNAETVVDSHGIMEQIAHIGNVLTGGEPHKTRYETEDEAKVRKPKVSAQG